MHVQLAGEASFSGVGRPISQLFALLAAGSVQKLLCRMQKVKRDSHSNCTHESGKTAGKFGLVFTAWPSSSLWFIGILLGIDFLVIGLFLLVFASACRHDSEGILL